MRRLTLAALSAASLAVLLPSAASAQDLGYVPGQALVRFDPRLSAGEVRSTLDDQGATVERRLPLVPGLRQVDLPPGQDVPSAVADLERRPGVVYAEPDWRREAFATPNDPLFPQQWSLLNSGQEVFKRQGTPGADIHATPAWDVETGSPSVRVAVVDTGISLTHPDLVQNLWTNPGEIAGNGLDDDGNGYVDDVHGWDFTSNDSDPSDTIDPDEGHGTHIAGIIGAAANNGIGIAGINWATSLMAVRTPLDLVGEVAAFKYARDNGARVVNYSAGSAQYSPTERAAIEAAPNVLFVVAAGNDHQNTDADPVYPCSYPSLNIICVGATNQDDALSEFSNFGPATVDLAAPGENILSTFPGGAQARDFSDRFSEKPLSARWERGGKGRRWGLTQKLKRGLSITDSPKGRYRNHSNTWIRSRPIDLSTRRSCALEYYARLRTQKGHDFLIVEASHDPNKHWHPLRRSSGRSSRQRFVFLPKRMAGDDSVYLRFRLKSDARVRGNGVILDDINLSCETTGDTYTVLSGTSFSAPDVAGGAALALSKDPGLSIEDLRTKLLASTDPVPALAGRVATGGRLDLAKVVAP